FAIEAVTLVVGYQVGIGIVAGGHLAEDAALGDRRPVGGVRLVTRIAPATVEFPALGEEMPDLVGANASVAKADDGADLEQKGVASGPEREAEIDRLPARCLDALDFRRIPGPAFQAVDRKSGG